MNNTKTKWYLFGIDYQFLAIVLILLVVGLGLVYDASLAYSELHFDSKYFFFIKQLGWDLLGLVGMFAIALIDINHLRKYSVYIFGLGILLLGFVLIPSIFSPVIYGARRWILFNPDPFPSIPFVGIISFQPSEFAKLASLIYFSTFLTSKKYRLLSLLQVNRNVIILIVLVAGLVLLQPNYSTAFILAGIMMSVYVASGANMKYLAFEIPLALLCSIGYALSSPYRRVRIMALIDPNEVGGLGSGYHLNQIMIALGSGGLFGLGLGASVQKYAYLPEVTADSIFAVLGEELGFMGTTFLISIFILLVWRGFRIALCAKTRFGSLLVIGVISWISIQSLINLFAMVRLFPLTGIPLPLISSGGSSTIFIMLGLGIVLNVSRSATLVKT